MLERDRLVLLRFSEGGEGRVEGWFSMTDRVPQIIKGKNVLRNAKPAQRNETDNETKSYEAEWQGDDKALL